jgi:hypothetical protein
VNDPRSAVVPGATRLATAQTGPRLMADPANISVEEAGDGARVHAFGGLRDRQCEYID